MNPHLNDDQLIAALYGLGDTKSHLADCPECGSRLRAMGKIRLATVDSPSADSPSISARKLAVQRQQVLARIERTSAGWSAWRWIPVGAAASLLAMALFLARPSGAPAPVPVPSVSVEADSELFTDVYSMERDVEPRAAAPIRALFEETSFEKESQ